MYDSKVTSVAFTLKSTLEVCSLCLPLAAILFSDNLYSLSENKMAAKGKHSEHTSSVDFRVKATDVTLLSYIFGKLNRQGLR